MHWTHWRSDRADALVIHRTLYLLFYCGSSVEVLDFHALIPLAITWHNVSVKSKLQHAPPPPGIPRAFDTFDVPGRGGGLGIWLSESSKGWGIWSPCFRGGEFELHPRFHVKSLAWWAIIGDAVLEDFRGKDCAFVANWLRGKGLSKLCAVFEVFKF